jgi:hypothetical protein
VEREMGDGRESLLSAPNYNTPVEDLSVDEHEEEPEV